MKAKLILENGMVFEGKAFGYLKESIGEVVFTTGMTGYQEVLTDPSYYGQIVTMTYPLIGNYGINLEDMESDSIKVRGFIVREKCNLPSNFRCELELEDFLKQGKIIGLGDIDTRALTKVLRNSGTMRGIIALEDLDDKTIKEKVKSFSNKEAVKNVTTKEKYVVNGNGKHIAIMDFGIKQNIITNFKKRGCKLTVFPATASAEEILSVNPDLVFLSNGPGDPEDLDFVIGNVKKLVGKKPIVGICLGHQLLALTLGGKTTKLKFGHRGCNHPVKDLEENIVHITSQNHGYVVETLPEDVEVTHVNINDGTVEGLKHKTLPIYSVQFHPEASAGPKDSEYIFDKFLKYAL
ncbi:glutamine-hydrolyzing carbamoyl-phosphate synthase small subunit [Clostridium botulinum]|uniref:Carbamoyl phosphate synthase small chain n=1 Tax=Clostridium botulinum (strain Eklund 17B / Type B) TaxID=935198 RepID=B2THH2_CLOBB|nr:carbamoyl-phosphate synthase, small subunit [Clostridium botulinum B str. Eklund 17B (NRP)]MBY6977393.1 glutamine-hydrolyzing carbamoyl-phosphate synthase small subunit [Clostridium botulinum]MBY7001949.1 glutamine-hydrolyzing carbamoyl-phosphate synthase small subunit [Clostridium botulinum]MCR1275605.1 glutamine-hydrolyzing carbamoyl-phosphate synthase small subunit [Clostridium botulinum]NFD71053.1 glutamine-hydrolyzing carbamoyl-phosphate synthase small subunit [Clostridium botulinum]